MKKVLLGLSGGVDSTVAALLLQEQGYDVVGVYIVMHNLKELNDANIQKAKKVAKYLDIPFYVHNIEDSFKDEVYDYFVDSYKKGLTPNPCVVCNRKIKFGKMVEFADSMNINYIATGHYVRAKDGFIYKGLDNYKDQSYFLAEVDKEVINSAIFPLGSWVKDDVKKYATNVPILQEIAKQKESSEICFVEDSYIDILQEHIETNMQGVVKDLDGNEVGHHKGFMHYTIGKRRGFFVKGAHDPHYVVDIDANSNTIVVGKKDDLANTTIVISNINLFIDSNDFNANIKVRYRTSGVDGSVKIDKNIGIIELKEPVYGVAKGQFAVFYDNDKLLGGGEIIDIID
jgi:tRNA-specific 2-thiouridylase